MSNIPAGAWVVVADGGGARLFQNMGTDDKLSLSQHKVLGPNDLNNEGPSGHRPADSSAQATDEATFAKQLAHYLNAAALKQEFTDLVLMADPQTLGQMRPQLHSETTRRIVKEIAKTFTNAPVKDIEVALK